jgi:hypothetical protein
MVIAPREAIVNYGRIVTSTVFIALLLSSAARGAEPAETVAVAGTHRAIAYSTYLGGGNPAARLPRAGESCAGTIATFGDVAACVECLTAVEVECAARAATPGVAADAGDCRAVVP